MTQTQSNTLNVKYQVLHYSTILSQYSTINVHCSKWGRPLIDFHFQFMTRNVTPKHCDYPTFTGLDCIYE